MTFVPRDTELPLMAGTVGKEQVVQLAMSNRPEVVQAAAGMDAFRLEVCAQSKARGLQVPTLAAGSDLHARQVPLAVRTDAEYRPGAIAPEMPPGMVGRTEDRVARAWELSHRQVAVSEKAVNVIRLEASNAYLTWEAATRRRDEAKRRFEDARKMVEESRQVAAVKQDPELLFNNKALGGQGPGGLRRVGTGTPEDVGGFGTGDGGRRQPGVPRPVRTDGWDTDAPADQDTQQHPGFREGSGLVAQRKRIGAGGAGHRRAGPGGAGPRRRTGGRRGADRHGPGDVPGHPAGHGPGPLPTAAGHDPQADRADRRRRDRRRRLHPGRPHEGQAAAPRRLPRVRVRLGPSAEPEPGAAGRHRPAGSASSRRA